MDGRTVLDRAGVPGNGLALVQRLRWRRSHRPPMDVLSELVSRTELHVEEVRIHDFAGSWAVELPLHPLVFMVRRGECSVWPAGERHPRVLSEGHLLLISGDQHCTLQRFGPRLAATGPFIPSAGATLDRAVFPPRSEECVRILAARVSWINPFTDQLSLPRWLAIGPRSLSLSHDRLPLNDALAEELMVPRPGVEAVVERLLEAMLIRALRVELVTGFWSVPGWLGALTDPVMRGALGEAPDLSSLRSVRALAERAERSVRRLSARVKRTSGARPGKLLRQLRLAEVMQRLEGPAPRLLEVAHAAGYADVSTFCRAFRREVGCSPADYWRRRHRRSFPRGNR